VNRSTLPVYRVVYGHYVHAPQPTPTTADERQVWDQVLQNCKFRGKF